MTAPDRSLKKPRELKKDWSEGQQRTEQAVNSPHPLTAEAANPAADFPDARPAVASVTNKAGKFDHIQVPDETSRWMGFEVRKTVKADLQALAQRHPEYYENAQQVRSDIDFVLGKSDGWYNHKDNKVVLFRARVGNGATPQAKVEVEADAQSMAIRSIYIDGKRQIAKRMADKKAVLSGLDLGGQYPESLTIAEYLQALGNRSSRPTSPSDEALKAGSSVMSAHRGVKNETPSGISGSASSVVSEGLGTPATDGADASVAPATQGVKTTLTEREGSQGQDAECPGQAGRPGGKEQPGVTLPCNPATAQHQHHNATRTLHPCQPPDIADSRNGAGGMPAPAHAIAQCLVTAPVRLPPGRLTPPAQSVLRRLLQLQLLLLLQSPSAPHHV